MENFKIESVYVGILESASADVWQEAESWYPKAHRLASWLSSRYGKDLATVSALMSVFSIRTTWKDNKRRLVRYLATGEARGTSLQKKKIQEIESADGDIKALMLILSGDKIKRFFHNILFPNTSPFATLDSWMVGVLPDVSYNMLPRFYGHVKSLYSRIESVIRKIAKRLKKPVSVIQACIWIIVRGGAS